MTDPDVFDADLLAFQSALAGEYSIERELGRGGMAIVYLAREVRLDRLVALKVMPLNLAARSELRERFMREARTSAKLSHPNIVPIFRVDEVNGFVFYAMAFVDGETLGQRIRDKGPLTPREAVTIIREVSWALAYAHARGIVHRDIKPDNILLEAGSGRALVTDFGIAQVAESTALTQDGMVMGTAHYMSPEQAAGESIDGRSDLYSLGVVSYYALTGKLPFDSPTMGGLLAMHLTQPPPPIASVSSGVPRSLAAAIERCLVKDASGRYPTGEALAEAVTSAAQPTRDVPAPVRVWAAKGTMLIPIYGIWYTIGILNLFDHDVDWTNFAGLLAPMVFHLAYITFQTRRALQAGYGLEDLRIGLRAHIEQREEERAYDIGREPSLLAKLIRWVTYGGLAGFAVTVVGILVARNALPDKQWGYWCASTAAVAIGGGAIGIMYPGRRISSRNWLDSFRLRVWNGRFGQWIQSLASWKLDRRALASDAAHRPTELVIGLAADGLFESLPKPVKQELRELPNVMRQLEGDAQAMRKRIEELTHTIESLGSDDVSTRSATLSGTSNISLDSDRRSLQAELESAKDAASRRLSAAVGALERIRLGLIRLRAGAATTADVTTTIAAARRVTEEVEYQLHGVTEASAALRAPSGR
jgi:eukaryotic-like serine/threonine-protein kinase